MSIKRDQINAPRLLHKNGVILLTHNNNWTLNWTCPSLSHSAQLITIRFLHIFLKNIIESAFYVTIWCFSDMYIKISCFQIEYLYILGQKCVWSMIVIAHSRKFTMNFKICSKFVTTHMSCFCFYLYTCLARYFTHRLSQHGNNDWFWQKPIKLFSKKL